MYIHTNLYIYICIYIYIIYIHTFFYTHTHTHTHTSHTNTHTHIHLNTQTLSLSPMRARARALSFSLPTASRREPSLLSSKVRIARCHFFHLPSLTPVEKFSKVSTTFIVYSRFSHELTFENMSNRHTPTRRVPST